MLIGLNGEARSGKDTSGGYIIDFATKLHFPARRDAFADRLKVSAARALGMANDSWGDCIDAMNVLKTCGSVTTTIEHGPDDYQEITISGREYLQYYGTEAHRDVFTRDFWIRAVLDIYDLSEILVVTDVRFENEAEAVRDAGGRVWRIERPGVQKIASAAHASERPLPDHLVDVTIVNDGSLGALQDKVLSHFERSLYSYGQTTLGATA